MSSRRCSEHCVDAETHIMASLLSQDLKDNLLLNKMVLQPPTKTRSC
jgi:hypothetical protein